MLMSEKMTHAEKLKNKDSASKYYGEKFRTGKADNSISEEEARRREKVNRQGKKKSAEIEAKKKAEQKARNVSKCSDKNSHVGHADNSFLRNTAYITGFVGKANDSTQYDSQESDVAEEVVDAGGYIASGAVSRVTSKPKNTKYSDKLHGRKETGGEAARNAAKRKMQREAQKKAAQNSSKTVENSGKIGRKITDKAEDVLGLIGEWITEFVQDNPIISIIIVVVFLIILMFSGMMTSCSSAASSLQGITIITTYSAEDDDILGAEEDYKDLEDGLQEELDNIESDYEGYDEYVYHCDEIGHNPYQLAAILTVLFINYKRAEVQFMLQEIFNLQYELTTEETVEIREREIEVSDIRWVEDDSFEDGGYWEPYTYTDTEEYEYYILNIYLVNHTLDEVVNELGFTEDEMTMYKVLMETFGNRRYLFGEDDIYNVPGMNPGDSETYHVPGEYLTDEQFARMLHEAESHLGTPYVWGGYSLSGFDCSGFVSWVINHCGNGWNFGRLTANGLRARTGYVDASEAKPGDLVFFQGTYDTSGCSHVGIYVGNGMMIHAGNPVKYSSINTPYWQAHMHSFGRIQ